MYIQTGERFEEEVEEAKFFFDSGWQPKKTITKGKYELRKPEWYFGMGNWHLENFILVGAKGILKFQVSNSSPDGFAQKNFKPSLENATCLVYAQMKNSPEFKGWHEHPGKYPDKPWRMDLKSPAHHIQNPEELYKLIEISLDLEWEENARYLTNHQQQNLNEIVLTHGWEAVSFPQQKIQKFRAE